MTDQTGKGAKTPPRINIFKAWCKGCGICAAFCPKRSLPSTRAALPMCGTALCARCGLCELRCPDFAITIDEERGEEDDSQEGP